MDIWEAQTVTDKNPQLYVNLISYNIGFLGRILRENVLLCCDH